jgi:hypothetical protein
MKGNFAKLIYLNLFLFLFGFLHAADIAVVTMAVGQEYEKMVGLGIENKRLYCEKHGYDFIYTNESLDLSRPIPWSKIKLLANALKQKDYKWVFWTDADALIMNQAIPLEDLIDENYDLILTKDMNEINSGNFLLKNSEWSKQFLETIYNHTECIHHPWWEQQAIITEHKNNEDVQKRTRIVPQRVMNSYSSELLYRLAIPGSLSSNFQSGDFIIHFAACPKNELENYMQKYAALVVDKPDFANLDTYLGFYGMTLSPRDSQINEGYCTDTQKRKFIEDLNSYANIKKIAEIGLNAGHSVQIFFENCPDVKVLSFDLNHHYYTKAGLEFMHRKYKNRFNFIEGDSTKTVPQYTSNNPEDKYDLIYIDGDHRFQGCYSDLVNCQKLATRNTIVWVDDYTEEVQNAVDLCVSQGLMKVIKYSSDRSDPCGPRAWIEARYLLPNDGNDP